MGEGSGGGDAAQFVGDRLIKVGESCWDQVNAWRRKLYPFI